MNKKILHTVFEEVVKKQPLNIAVETETISLTYNDLNIYANRLSNLLSSLDFKVGMIVNVVIPSSVQFVGSMLGILKSGGVFLPVDITFSEKRLKQILTETCNGIVMATEDTFEFVSTFIKENNITITHLIVVDDQIGFKLFKYTKDDFIIIELEEKPEWRIDRFIDISSDSNNYIFYTSGTTGDGKAIVGRNSSLSHFIHWEIKEFEIDNSFRISQLTQVTFDPSLRDIFVALISGGTLCIPSVNIKSDPVQIVNWLERSKINLVHCVPTLFRLLTRELAQEGNDKKEFDHLKYILLAGEILYVKDVLNWRKTRGKNVNLVNLYGPTETTLAKLFHRIEEVSDNPTHIIPVGIPISNTIVAIINEGRICKVDEIGEIHIKTPFMTNGYYKNEKLTNECFIQNPLFSDTKDIVYKTGDIGRHLANGTIEVLGRLDSQVKINGIRVELLEVEQAILQNEDITGVVVKTHRTDDNFTSLIAYYTGTVFTTDQFRDSLAKLLNQQVIPSYFIHLTEFPLNINGKIDKKALPLPQDILIDNLKIEEPIGVFENKLAILWKEILGINAIGRNVSFFNVGGHSLRAIQLISRIHKEFGVHLKIADIFSQRTIQDLAQFISTSLTNEYKKIDRINDQEDYPISFSQRRLWILSQFEEASIAYHLPRVYEFKGKVDVELLNRSFRNLIARHEILRTVFRKNKAGEIVQLILPQSVFEFNVEYLDFRNKRNAVPQIDKEIDLLNKQAFDLTQGPLFRASLFQISDQEYIFFYNMHHIVSDSWSMAVLVKELLINYSHYLKGKESTLPKLLIQYRDYAAWQQGELNGNKLAKHKSYWLNQFRGELPVLNFPSDKLRPSVKTYNGKIISKTIDYNLSNGLKNLSEKHNATMFMGIITVINILLNKYTHQTDIIIGSPIAGRDHNDLEDQIGFYVNTLAIRSQFKVTDTFIEILDKVREVTLGAYEHQIFPFDALVNELNLSRDMSRNPLYDVSVSLQNLNIVNNDLYTAYLDEITVKEYKSEDLAETSKFDLSFNFTQQEKELLVNIEYNTDIYNHEIIEQLGNHLEQLLSAIIKKPEQAINEITYLNDSEIKEILLEFNNTKVSYPEEKTLIMLFEEQVKKRPDNIAVIFKEKEFSYKQLDEKSNQFARYLQKKHSLKPNEFVAIKLDRSEWMIISILSILKSGAAYIPIDPGYPKSRIDYIIEDSNCKIVIDENELENFQKQAAIYENTNVGITTKPTDLAYIIYTSGSTGNPKGCMLENKGVVNRIEWMWKQYNYTPQDVILQKTTFTFDVSVWEIFMPLCWGAKMVLCEKNDAGSPENILQLIDKHKVTCLHFVPSMLNIFISIIFQDLNKIGKLSSLTKVITSGESLPVKTVAEWYKKTDVTIHNLYGPTEASVDVTYYETKKGDKKIPIGRPIANTQMYILDAYDKICPKGVSGQIAIGGDGLAIGYLNKPELTKEKFIESPFKKGERIYKTGDWGRWLFDGNIEYIGRQDDQVKIRGYRIELGEIESALQKYKKVDSAVVTTISSSGGENELVAYIVSKEKLNTSEISMYLSELIPTYMIPNHYVQLDALPLTSSGKISRKNLPHPQDTFMQTGEAHLPPRNDMERDLVSIWQQVLNRPVVGIKDNFFEIGGNSLKLLQMLELVNKAFKINMPGVMAFKFPTVYSLAQYLHTNNDKKTETDIDETVDIMEETLNILNDDRN